jgi:myo-inositol-1(or 4)-monophosphatase
VSTDAEPPDGRPGRTQDQAGGSASSAELLEVAVEGARLAGALLAERARRGAEREVSSKSTPTDLVSEADLASERAIRELLAERRPNDGFLGEEGGRAEQGRSGLDWVVDPLDGTINFLFGIPQWCVSVAVRDSEGTVAGAVYDPNRDELFTATRDGRPVLAGPDGTVELSRAPAAPGASPRIGEPAGVPSTGEPTRPVCDDLATAMVATGLAYDANVRGAQARVLERLAPRVRDIRRFGSAALDLTWTAAGRYDAYFERSVKQWDIAAGTLICERAGLVVLELPVHENLPWGILVAPPALAERLLALVAGP